ERLSGCRGDQRRQARRLQLAAAMRPVGGSGAREVQCRENAPEVVGWYALFCVGVIPPLDGDSGVTGERVNGRVVHAGSSAATVECGSIPPKPGGRPAGAGAATKTHAC